MVKMRVAYVVFRVTMELRVDGVVAQYELVFRLYGASKSVSIRRLEGSTTTGFLPFDPVTIQVEDVQVDTIPGEYVAKLTFLKRATNGSLVAHVPVVWRLSPTLGVSGELVERLFPISIFPLGHPASAFDSAVRDALASPFVAWSVDVEHARFDTLVSGAITLEGFLTDGLRESSSPVRIHAELLPDGTATGVCIGEASRSPVTGTWTARKFSLSTEVQRSVAAHASRLVQFDAMRVSEYQFMESWPESVEAHGPQTHFTLQITRVGQGSGSASEPLDCYQEARLAVLSASTRESAARGLPNALWRQIFAFYDVSWFVQVKPRTKNSVPRQVVQPRVVLPTVAPEYAEIDDAGDQVKTSAETRVAMVAKRHESLPPVNINSLEFRWPVAAFVGIAALVVTWMLVTPNELFDDYAADSALQGSESPLFSNFSSIDHSAPHTRATRHRDGTSAHGNRASDFNFDAGAKYCWRAIVLAALINAGCATLPRLDPSSLSSLLIATGFLLMRLVNAHPVAFTGNMVDLCCEVTILVAACGWMCTKTVVHAFPAWELLPRQSRFVLWGCNYVLPFCIALNISSIVSVLRSKLMQSLQWPKIPIGGYVDLFAVVATSLIVGELIKLVFSRLLHVLPQFCPRHFRRLCLLVVVISSVTVISASIRPHHAMLGIVFLPLTRQQTKVAAATQAGLLGGFVQGYASYLDQLQRHS